MSKVIVTNSIKIGEEDISNFELASGAVINGVDSTGRSAVSFDSTNSKLEITKADYPKGYVTVYNSRSKSKKIGIDSSNYQAKHSHYLAKVDSNNIWLCTKGTRPSLTEAYSFSVAGSYVINKDAVAKTIILTKPDSSTIAINKPIFHVLIGAAGGGGHGGLYEVGYYIVHCTQKCITGARGGSGASLFATVDMTSITQIKFEIGEGGYAGCGDVWGGDGEKSSVTITYDDNSTYSIELEAGKGGGVLAIADLNAWTDHNFDFVSKNEYGSAGTAPALNQIPNLYNLELYNGVNGKRSSNKLIIKDAYSEAASKSVNILNIGNGGSLPAKPGFAIGLFANSSSGSRGANGFLKIYY